MIESMIAGILNSTELSSPENLDGFFVDADYFLGAMKICDTCSVSATGDPNNCIVATVVLNESPKSIQEIIWAVQEVWPKLSYYDLDATSLVVYEEGIFFRFVTAVPAKKLCVTGMLVFKGGPYHELYEEYLERFRFAGANRQHAPGHLQGALE